MADTKLTAGNDTYVQPLEARSPWTNYYGLEGDDVFALYNGVVNGGPGNDRIEKVDYASEWWLNVQVAYWDSPVGVVVDLAAGTAEDGWGGHDTLVGVTSVHGSGRDDTLKGSAANNFFWPNGGKDLIDGRGGVDTVGIGWFTPTGAKQGRQAQLDDLDIQVSIDGRTAVIKPKAGAGFELQLTDVERFQINGADGTNATYTLADFIQPQDMARQAIEAGGSLRWNAAAALGTAVEVTYSFVLSAPASGPGATGFRSFNVAEQQVVRELLATLAGCTGLSFREVAEGGGNVGQIRFGVSQQADAKGQSWLPNQAGVGDSAGDVWMDVESMASLARGSEGFAALIHELGHALGLRHPVNTDPGDAWSAQLRATDDRTALTAMSGQASADGLFRADFGPLDLLALRELYGSKAVAAGDTVVRLGSAQTGAQTTLVDDGGTDTLDASALPVGAKLDLVPGHLGSVGVSAAGVAAVDNLALLATTVIENAVGTAYDDVLLGNDADNRLAGGLGNDWIDGAKGTDTAVFAGLRGDYEVSTGFGKVYVKARDGQGGFDTLLSIEALQFADQVVVLSATALAADASFSLDEDGTLTGALPASSDLAASNASYALATGPAHGSASISATGALTYVPAADYWGSDALTFDLIGPAGRNRYVAYLEVRPVNDAAPVGRDGEVLAIAGQAVTASLPPATDADHDALRYSLLSDPASGAVDLAAGGAFTYVAKAGFSGSDSFRFSVSDGMGGSSAYTAWVTVAAVAQTHQGTAGRDDLVGGSAGDGYLLGAGDDRVLPKGGADVIDGGEGRDTLQLQAARSGYTLQSHGSWWSVSDAAGLDGTDRVTAVERLQFTDGWVALDLQDGQHGAQAAQILRGLFGAAALKVPLYAGYAVGLLDQGMSYDELVAFALQTEAFWSQAGSSLAAHPNEALVKAVYRNVIGVDASAAEVAYYAGLVSSGAFTQASLATMACQTVFNTGSADLVGLAAQGLDYVLPPGVG